LERYERQIRIFGVEGQVRLKKSKVLVAGVGGLGCTAALFLAASGVGNIVLVDSERVELNNLNRQVLHWTRDIGVKKVYSAAKKLKELNPEVNVEVVDDSLREDNVYDYVKRVDLVVDGLDNWRTRFIVNKVCVELGKPFIHAGVHEVYGQLLVIVPGKGPCLQCIIPKPPPETPNPPMLSTTPGILALLEVTEAIKIITGYGKPAIGKMIIYDGYAMTFNEIQVKKRPNCPVCGKNNPRRMKT